MKFSRHVNYANSRYKRNRENKVTRKLNAGLTIIKKEQVSYH